MTANMELLRRIGAVALCVLVLLALTWGAYLVLNKWDNEYGERRDRRRELIRECTAKGGTPVITWNRTGRLTGYYGCTLPQD